VDHLSALDASFLAAERPGIPLHIGGLARFEAEPLLDDAGRLRIDEVRALVEAHLAAIPRFRQRLDPTLGGLGLPAWVDDEDFDIAEHVRLRHVPDPSDAAALHALAMAIQGEILPRHRPLWELTFLDGLADGTVAMVDKAHHALVDGVSGSESFIAMLDARPDAPGPVRRPWAPGSPPGLGMQALDALTRAGRLPLDAAHQVGRVVRDPSTATDMVRAVAETVRTRRPAPPCSLNAPVGPHRDHRVVRWSLDDAKAVAHATGTTVNDVAMVAVTGGLRALLAERGELDGLPHLTALVPVSTRGDDELLGLGNRVSAMLASLPVGEADPLDALGAVAADMAGHKSSHEIELVGAALGVADVLPLPLVRVLSDLTVNRQPLVNLVVTNVRGSPTPLYLLGARMLEFLPYVPLGANTTVGVAILSYAGQLDAGVTVDPEACPDATVLVEGMEATFASMRERTAA
jgi:diacylglycerol O-acyltransferase